MSEVKIGDKVLLKCFKGVRGVNGNHCGWVRRFSNHVGKVVVVTGISERGNIEAEELGSYKWSKDYVEVVSTAYPNPPHKHAELIKAWADGAEVEYLNFSGTWRTMTKASINFVVNPERKFRIKPQKSEREIEIERIESEMRKLADSLKELKDASN